MSPAYDLLLFRINKLASIAGQPLVRLCEGRYGITRREWRLILVLAQDGPLLSSELARRSRIERARTSAAISQMVSAGLAQRVPRAGDRRFVEIHLTDKARDIFDSLFPEVLRLNERMLSVLSADEARVFVSLLERLEAQALANIKETELPKADRRHRNR